MATFGVLELQGDWQAHGTVLRGMGADVQPVRTVRDLDAVDALVIPGGESSAILRLMEPEDLAGRLRDRIKAGMAVLATCAGVILLAETVEPQQTSLGVLSVGVLRNAYGRQVHSTIDRIDLDPVLGEPPSMEGVFIRAPQITRVDAGVEVLGRWRDDAVLVRQGNIVGATFHPELTDDRRIHELFRRMGEA